MSTPYGSAPLRRFLLDLTDGPFGSKLTGSHYSDDGARVIRLGNIGEARFKPDDKAYIPMGYFEELRQHSVKSGDLLIAGLGDSGNPLGRACLAPEGLGPAIVKADCYRARLDESQLLHRFAVWALNTAAAAQQVMTLSRGSTRARINLDVAKAIEIPVPPVEVQRAIAAYLDRETARIDTLIEEQQRLTELLRERRDGVVTKTFLDLTGEERSLKYAVDDVTVGIVVQPSRWYVDAGVPALRGVNVKRGSISFADMVHISEEGHAANLKSQLCSGDVVVVRTGQAGAAAKIPDELDGANAIDILIVRPGCNTDPDFLTWYLNSPLAASRIKHGSVGALQGHFNVSALRQLPFCDASLAEQRRIVDILDEKVANIDTMIVETERFIEFSRERRAALITAAVAGQIDTREMV